MTAVLLAVVAEAPRDATVVKRLVERVGGVEASLVAPSTGVPAFIKWADVPKLLLQHRVKPWHGHFDGRPGKADSVAAANALRVLRDWMHGGPELHTVVLQRDIDNQPERRAGLHQGCAVVPLEVPVVVGVAVAKIEAWAICAFEPAAADEHACLRGARKELGFDPRERSHELDASEKGAKRDAKRVLEELLGVGEEAFEPLCETTSLDTLRARGSKNGLAAFLSDIAAVLENLAPGGRPTG